jgi:hypothetical protein
LTEVNVVMDLEKEKDARPQTPANLKDKVDVVGSASTWGSRQLEQFEITLDQEVYLDLKDVIDPKWFDFSTNPTLEKGNPPHGRWLTSTTSKRAKTN